MEVERIRPSWEIKDGVGTFEDDRKRMDLTPKDAQNHRKPHSDQVAVAEGQAQLQRLNEFARQPRYGACWITALERVHIGCKEFTDEAQSRIALGFTHCHLQRSGRSFPACSEEDSIQVCTQHMDSVAFGVYTEFFTHTHSICYFLQNEIWQQQAENTIDSLMASVIFIGTALVLKLNNGKYRLQWVETSRGVKRVFEEMKHSANEQQLIFSEIFNRLSYLQSFVVTESNTLYSLLVNLMALGAVFLVTSTTRTSGARLFLFSLVALNVYLERLICSMVMESNESGFDQANRIAFLVGVLRRCMIGLGILVLVYFIIRFRDLGQESLEILKELKETQSNLQQALREAEKIIRPLEAELQIWEKQPLLESTRLDSGILEVSTSSPRICMLEETVVQKDPHSSDIQNSTKLPSDVKDTPKRVRQKQTSRRYSCQSPSAVVYSVLVDDDTALFGTVAFICALASSREPLGVHASRFPAVLVPSRAMSMAVFNVTLVLALKTFSRSFAEFVSSTTLTISSSSP
ncbi:GEX1 protein, partial [Polypterus senegalus]